MAFFKRIKSRRQKNDRPPATSEGSSCPSILKKRLSCPLAKRLSDKSAASSTDESRRPSPPFYAAHFVQQLIKQMEWEEVINQIAETPDLARTTIPVNEGGTLHTRLALHEACRYKAPLQVVDALVNAYPDALWCRDSMYHFLPIHFACRYGSSAQVVQYLVQQNPESIDKEDKHGYTPESMVRRSSQSNKEEVLMVLRKAREDEGSGGSIVI